MLWLRDQLRALFEAILWGIGVTIIIAIIVWFFMSSVLERVLVLVTGLSIFAFFAWLKHRNYEVLEHSPTLEESTKTHQKGHLEQVSSVGERETAKTGRAYVSDSELSNIHHILRVLGQNGAFKDEIDLGALLNKDASEFENVVDYSKHKNAGRQDLNLRKSGNSEETLRKDLDNTEETDERD